MYSIETIRHFTCDHCSHWWSISDAPENRIDWYCPWCGVSKVHTEIEKKKEVEHVTTMG